MLTKAELIDAKEELMNSKSTIQNCEKLAAVCTVLHHCYDDNNDNFNTNYSGDNVPEIVPTIKHYGDTRFLSVIEGMDPDDIFPLIDELVSAIQILNPRLYASFMRKITEY